MVCGCSLDLDFNNSSSKALQLLLGGRGRCRILGSVFGSSHAIFKLLAELCAFGDSGFFRIWDFSAFAKVSVVQSQRLQDGKV